MNNMINANGIRGRLRRWRSLLRDARHLARSAHELMRTLTATPLIPDRVSLVLRHADFKPIQLECELVQFIEQVEMRQPRTILEIGTARGGMTLLLASTVRPKAHIVTIDLMLDWPRRRALNSLSNAQRRFYPIRGNSASSKVIKSVAKIARHVGGFDVIFIDGDHTLRGVCSDFGVYSQFAAANAVIAFHDIMPDGRVRDQKQRPEWVGDVPLLWRAVCQAFPERTSEIIADPS
jgi:predicted O-methyltransferase YrrM